MLVVLIQVALINSLNQQSILCQTYYTSWHYIVYNTSLYILEECTMLKQCDISLSGWHHTLLQNTPPTHFSRKFSPIPKVANHMITSIPQWFDNQNFAQRWWVYHRRMCNPQAISFSCLWWHNFHPREYQPHFRQKKNNMSEAKHGSTPTQRAFRPYKPTQHLFVYHRTFHQG